MSTTPTQYRLGPDTLAQLDSIRDHLRRLTGTDHSRAAAIRFAAQTTAETIDAKQVALPRNKSRKNLAKSDK